MTPARLYIAFDDTDTLDADRGTGKVGRWFADELPDDLRFVGVVRQQLLFHPDVPYTSHNSAAVVVAEEMSAGTSAADLLVLTDEVIARAIDHLERLALAGSDPGLCVAWDRQEALGPLTAFGGRAATVLVTQAEARAAATAARAHLSGHGGTFDGVIGAAAGVGLTAGGWNGRFIELAAAGHLLRDFPDPVTVAELLAADIAVAAIDRDAPVPLPDQLVTHAGWLRPRLWAGRPVVPVQRADGDLWVAVGPRTAAFHTDSDPTGGTTTAKASTEDQERASTADRP